MVRVSGVVKRAMFCLVVFLDLLVGNRRFVGDVFGQQRYVGDLAVFRRGVARLVLLEPRRQNVVGRLLDRLHERLRQHDVFRGPVLAAIERHGAQEGVGRLEPVGYGFHDLLADRHLGAVPEIVFRPHADLLEREFELLAVEFAVRTLEGRIVHRQPGQLVLGEAEAKFARLLVENRACDQLRQHLVFDAERLCLLAGDPGSELLRQHRQLAVVGEAVFDRRNGRAAGGDHRVAAESVRHLAGNAPDGKAHHEHDEEKFRHPGSGGSSQG